MCDGFDFGQSDDYAEIDDCGDGYFNDALTFVDVDPVDSNSALSSINYADIFLENFQL